MDKNAKTTRNKITWRGAHRAGVFRPAFRKNSRAPAAPWWGLCPRHRGKCNGCSRARPQAGQGVVIKDQRFLKTGVEDTVKRPADL